jgi:hypothetical protein
MTRKQALQYAIDVIKNSENNSEESRQAEECLISLSNDLPLTTWSKDAIFDACNQYCEKHNRPYLTVTDFKSRELPPHATIKKRFGITAAEFRDKYYPRPMSNHKHNVYCKMTKEEYTYEFACFCANYSFLTQDEYNKRRPSRLPTWSILAKMNNVDRWSELLKIAGVNFEKNKRIKLSVTSESRSGNIEKLKEYIEKKKG